MARERALTTQRPIFTAWPTLKASCPFADFGNFPTPVEPLGALAPRAASENQAYVKRDDLTSDIYGGNKVRTLEPLLGHALRRGCDAVWATGAYGSNHAVATAMHARRVGLRTGAMLFPQPASPAARENLRVSLQQADWVWPLRHWSLLPLGMWWARRRAGGRSCFVMPPGGASPRGCLGFFSGALELASQVRAGLLPWPREVVVAVGSTCSTAGLLLGLYVAAHQARVARPSVIAVRVTPWPVTSRFRIASLARRTAVWLRELTADPVFEVSRDELAKGLVVDGSQMGAGYGWPTPAGERAIETLAPLCLDTTYSAKSASALLERLQRDPGLPRVYWATKSSARLPSGSGGESGWPASMRRFLQAH